MIGGRANLIPVRTGDARWVNLGSSRPVTGFKGVVTLDDIVDQVVDQQQSICVHRDCKLVSWSRSSCVIPHEKAGGNFTHRVGIGFCAIGDPLLQLWLNVSALFGDLLRHRSGMEVARD